MTKAEAFKRWYEANREHRQEYERQRHKRRYAQRHSVKYAKRQSTAATRQPSSLDIAWAAGFFEGEAWFGLGHKNTKYPSATMSVHQKMPQPVEALKAMFGGTLIRRVSDKRWPGNEYWLWQANGVRARGVMMTVFKFMSDKRKAQIRIALQGQIAEEAA